MTSVRLHQRVNTPVQTPTSWGDRALFHPDCDRRPRIHTGSADPGRWPGRALAGWCMGGIAAAAHHRRWGLPPRPENAVAGTLPATRRLWPAAAARRFAQATRVSPGTASRAPGHDGGFTQAPCLLPMPDITLIAADGTEHGFEAPDGVSLMAAATGFGVPGILAVNKADLHEEVTTNLEELAGQRAIPVVGRIPYDRAVTQTQIARKTVVEASSGPAAQAIRSLWMEVKKHLDRSAPAAIGGLVQLASQE